MKKILIVAAALVALTTTAFAGSRIEVEANIDAEGVIVNGNYNNGPTIRGYGVRSGVVCPQGLRPAGRLGCMGETINNREDLQQFDRRIASGCVQGAVRVKWKEGIDPQGRPVKWQIRQHAECNSGR